MASPETVSLVYTPGQDCGMKRPCGFCWQGKRERIKNDLRSVNNLSPYDILAVANSIKADGQEVRLQRIAGHSGDFFYIKELDRPGIVSAMINTLTKPEISQDDGTPRIELVTNGLFVTKRKLRALLPFKKYLLFGFSVDSEHHNASGLCGRNCATQQDLFSQEHVQTCSYLARVKESTDLVRTLFGKEQVIVQSVLGKKDTEGKNKRWIANFFGIADEQAFNQPPCLPDQGSWQSKFQQEHQLNSDLIFVDNVSGQDRIYDSFENLLLGNSSEILTH